MKKNRMFRIASVMLVLAILTTCVISGTFAKYVTRGSGSDSARVAKWGVKVVVTGDELFNNKYDTDDNSATVQASLPVVAPGTACRGNGLHIKVTGTAETAFRVTLTMEATEDVYLEQGNAYESQVTFTESNGEIVSGNTFDVAEDYYPIVYTLTGTTSGTYHSLAEVATAINTASNGTDYAPGQPVNIDVTLTWSWVFAGHEEEDTYLGASANGPALDGAHTSIDYTVSVSAVQID